MYHLRTRISIVCPPNVIKLLTIFSLWLFSSRLTYSNVNTNAKSANKKALRLGDIRSPWNTFLGECSHSSMDNQCRPSTNSTQYLYMAAYAVNEITLAPTVPKRHRNWTFSKTTILRTVRVPARRQLWRLPGIWLRAMSGPTCGRSACARFFRRTPGPSTRWSWTAWRPPCWGHAGVCARRRRPSTAGKIATAAAAWTRRTRATGAACTGRAPRTWRNAGLQAGTAWSTWNTTADVW